jgi:hypothetical protein
MSTEDQAFDGNGAGGDLEGVLAEKQLTLVRDEIRFELQLLHERVNALLAAEAFLTIAYTAAMSNGAAWGHAFAAVAAPVLAILGLLLAPLASPGVAATARIFLVQTGLQRQLFERMHGSMTVGFYAVPGRSSAVTDQRLSLIFSRAVPLLFSAVWTALLVLTVILLT